MLVRYFLQWIKTLSLKEDIKGSADVKIVVYLRTLFPSFQFTNMNNLYVCCTATVPSFTNIVCIKLK